VYIFGFVVLPPATLQYIISSAPAVAGGKLELIIVIWKIRLLEQEQRMLYIYLERGEIIEATCHTEKQRPPYFIFE